MEKLEKGQVELALRDLRRQIRQLVQTIASGERIPLYSIFEELESIAHDGKHLVANGGKWKHEEAE